jgi:hypothetical protein
VRLGNRSMRCPTSCKTHRDVGNADFVGSKISAHAVVTQPTKLFLTIKQLQLSQNIVISAGIAEIQRPRMASDEHIPVTWIPAVNAGMTLLLKHLYIQETIQRLYNPQNFFHPNSTVFVCVIRIIYVANI